MHDAVDCDNDPASAGWTNWELAHQQTATIKIEPPVFQTLRPAPSGIINVDSPSPAKRAAPLCRFQIQIIYLVSKIVKKRMAFLVSVQLLVNLQAALVTRMLACWFLFRILVCLWFVRRMVLFQFPSASRFFNPWAFNCVFILCPLCQMESISYTMKTTCTSLPWSYAKALSKRLMMQLLFRSPCLP